LSRNGRKRGTNTGLRLHALDPALQQQSRAESEGGHSHERKKYNSISHGVSPCQIFQHSGLFVFRLDVTESAPGFHYFSKLPRKFPLVFITD